MGKNLEDGVIYSAITLIILQLIGYFLGGIRYSGYPYQLYVWSCSGGQGGCGFGSNLQTESLILDLAIPIIIGLVISYVKNSVMKK